MVLSEIQPPLHLLHQPPRKEMGDNNNNNEQPPPPPSPPMRQKRDDDEEVTDPPPLPATDAHDTRAAALPSSYSNDDPNNNDDDTDSARKQKQLLQTPSQHHHHHYDYAAPQHHPHHHPHPPPPHDSALRDFAHLATTPGLTPGGFGIFGSGGHHHHHHTPHHHSHLTPGTSSSGILKPSTYVAAGGGGSSASASATTTNMEDARASMAAAAGLSAMGLVRGDNTLQPTPVVRRGEQHHQHQQQQQQHNFHFYQPGMHYHQGMVPQSEMKSAAELAARSNAFFRANDPTTLNYDLRPGESSSSVAKKVSHETNDDEDGSKTAAAASSSSSSSAVVATPQQQQQAQQQPMLSEFPFIFDGYAGWVCRHCSHLAYYYRGPNYVWKNPQPPPNYFVDQHLMFCPGLNPAIAANVEAMRQQSLSAQKMTPPDAKRQSMAAATSELKRKLDPPTGRSPQPPSAAAAAGKKSNDDELPMLPNTATKDQTTFWSNQWSSFQQQTPSQLMPPGLSPPAASSTTYHQPNFMQQTSGLKRKSFKRKSSEIVDKEGRPVMQQKPHKVRKPYQHKSPAAIPSNDNKYNEAFDLLSAKADEIPKAKESNSDIGTTLVEADDSELLTDYFYYMMMQLVVCRFSEADKKTRGGKRDNIAIGYGGLQCIHCSTNDYSRKFYWSTVDRLANSFAEIPAHILKCKSCPADVRDALLVLKDRHPTQMSSRPRGSQKVFFRRVWRRLHSGDIDAAEKAPPSSRLVMSPKLATSVDVESALKSPEIASGTAARMLKASTTAESATQKERVVLALPQDKDWLSDMDCFVRNNVEIFSATENDLAVAKTDKKYPIKLGQVGLRCMHCAGSDIGARREAVMYPYSISGIYESVRDFQKLHLDYCPHLPPDLKGAMSKLTHGCSSLSSVLRRYYVQAARALGLFDSEDGGIRAGGTVIPMISSGFSTSESNRKRSATSSSDNTSSERAGSKRQKVTRTEEV